MLIDDVRYRNSDTCLIPPASGLSCCRRFGIQALLPLGNDIARMAYGFYAILSWTYVS